MMSWKWIAGAQLLAGLLLIGAGLVGNPILVAGLAADGHLAQPLRVLLADVVLVGLGVLVLRRAARTRRERRDFRKAQFLAAATAATLSFLFCALVAELVVRATVDPLRFLDGDTWWEYRWRQSETGRTPGASTMHGYEEFDPARGWRARHGFESEEVRTNAMGLRAAREYSLARVPDTGRILLIGDSFTWGEDVADDETFAFLLEERLEDTEVINLGVRGYGTDQQLIYLRELGLDFQPDVVVLGLFEENVYRNVLTFRDYAKPRFVLENGELVLVNTPVPDPETIRSRELDLPASRLAALVAALWGELIDRTRFREPHAEREETILTLAILDAAKREAAKAGAEFVVMFVPWSNFEEAKPVGEALARWADSTGTAYLDLAVRFQQLSAEQKADLYIPGGHWTPFGHSVVASALDEHLRSRGWIEERR